MGEGEDDGSAIFIANSGANFIAVIGEYLEIKYESLPSLTRNTIRRMVVQRAYSKWLMSVAISLRFSWFYGPFVGDGSGGNEIDGAQFVNGEFIGGEKWKRDTIVRNR